MDCYEWSGYEDRDLYDRDLENLLIWWGTRAPYVHSDTCTEPDQMHCCGGKPEEMPVQGLSASSPPWDCPPVYFIPDTTAPKEEYERHKDEVLIERGDRIYYDHNNEEFRLVKK